MNKEELAELIDSFGKNMPERLTGNEENEILADRMAGLVQTERVAVVELLRDWLSVRVLKTDNDPSYGRKVGTMFLALRVAEKYSLRELRSDIEALIADVRSGKTFLPYYADMIGRYLSSLA